MKFGIAEIHGLIPSAARIKAALESLTGGDRLQASAIQGIYPRMYRINPVSFTGSTAANQQVGAIVFPANTFQDGDYLQTFFHFGPRDTTTTGSCTGILEYVHSGGTQTLFNAANTAQQRRQAERRFSFEAANLSFHFDSSNANPLNVASGGMTRPSTNLAASSTLRFAFTLTVAADVWWLNHFFVVHWRSVIL